MSTCRDHISQLIFDSNEEIAFPLCKESLDCCTWEINNDERNGTCSFVKFIDGWIFCEQEKKSGKNWINVNR